VAFISSADAGGAQRWPRRRGDGEESDVEAVACSRPPEGSCAGQRG
jgi:hypothetical protein